MINVFFSISHVKCSLFSCQTMLSFDELAHTVKDSQIPICPQTPLYFCLYSFFLFHYWRKHSSPYMSQTTSGVLGFNSCPLSQELQTTDHLYSAVSSISFFWFLYISIYTCLRPSHHKNSSPYHLQLPLLLCSSIFSDFSKLL